MDHGAPQTGLGDIVVTARKQNESMQKTPIAITAINAAAIEKLNVQQIDKVAQIAPNLIISQQNALAGAGAVFIRGIGQGDPLFAYDSSVGIYVDGAYMARTAGALFDLVDVERIEVLRGPQGTLFGRNTTGGAIQVITRKPDDAFGASLRGSYGRYDDRSVRGRIDTGKIGNLPIAAAFSYMHRERDGYFDNILTPDRLDNGASNSDALSVALRADLGKLKLDYVYDRDDQWAAPPFLQTTCFYGAPGCPAPDPMRGQLDTYAYYSQSAALGGAPLQFVGPNRRLNRCGIRAFRPLSQHVVELGA